MVASSKLQRENNDCIVAYPSHVLRKYFRYLRKQEYYINTANGSKRKGLLAVYYEGKEKRLGTRLDVEIGLNCFGKGLNLYYTVAVSLSIPLFRLEKIVVSRANCIGNNGLTVDCLYRAMTLILIWCYYWESDYC